MTEARALLEEARDDMLTWHGRCPVVDRIDAFLAQDTAQKAAYVVALNAADEALDHEANGCSACDEGREKRDHPDDGWACPELLRLQHRAMDLRRDALADTSPAAAALLAQGKTLGVLRAELVELVDGQDSTLADQIRDLVLNFDEGILCGTCAGSGVAPVSDWDLGSPGVTMSPCPDCGESP